jgi:hypothetical protein
MYTSRSLVNFAEVCSISEIIGESRLFALVKPLHPEKLLAPVGELEHPCLWRDQIMLTRPSLTE